MICMPDRTRSQCVWCRRTVSDGTLPVHHSCRVQEQYDVIYRLTRNVSRRGSILAGGCRPYMEQKWTQFKNRCVSQGQAKSAEGFIVLMQVKEYNFILLILYKEPT